jgi:hypothetical protein
MNVILASDVGKCKVRAGAARMIRDREHVGWTGPGGVAFTPLRIVRGSDSSLHLLGPIPLPESASAVAFEFGLHRQILEELPDVEIGNGTSQAQRRNTMVVLGMRVRTVSAQELDHFPITARIENGSGQSRVTVCVPCIDRCASIYGIPQKKWTGG